jgi:hypothetical protein
VGDEAGRELDRDGTIHRAGQRDAVVAAVRGQRDVDVVLRATEGLVAGGRCRSGRGRRGDGRLGRGG